LSNSIYLENALIEVLAERINGARKIYGQDSAYVIGLITAIDWIAVEADGGDALRQALHSRIDSNASSTTATTTSKIPVRPEREAVEAPASSTDALAENTWIKGAVKWFNNDKGYGFISTDSQVDVFVHWRDISSWDRSLVQGDEVEFMVTRTAKGYQAINVMKAGSEEQVEGQEGASHDDQTVEGSDTGFSAEEEQTAGLEGRDEAPSDEASIDEVPSDEAPSDEENVY